jgi:hypothetical protein
MAARLRRQRFPGLGLHRRRASLLPRRRELGRQRPVPALGIRLGPRQLPPKCPTLCRVPGLQLTCRRQLPRRHGMPRLFRLPRLPYLRQRSLAPGRLLLRCSRPRSQPRVPRHRRLFQLRQLRGVHALCPRRAGVSIGHGLHRCRDVRTRGIQLAAQSLLPTVRVRQCSAQSLGPPLQPGQLSGIRDLPRQRALEVGRRLLLQEPLRRGTRAQVILDRV